MNKGIDVANTGIAKETPLMRRALPDVPGKEALIETVVLAPGEIVPAHNADVFAYVLEGSIITQVQGGKPPDSPRRRSLLRIPHGYSEGFSTRACKRSISNSQS